MSKCERVLRATELLETLRPRTTIETVGKKQMVYFPPEHYKTGFVAIVLLKEIGRMSVKERYDIGINHALYVRTQNILKQYPL